MLILISSKKKWCTIYSVSITQQCLIVRCGDTGGLHVLHNNYVMLKFPGDFEISWNVHLTKTAGLCYYSQYVQRVHSSIVNVPSFAELIIERLLG